MPLDQKEATRLAIKDLSDRLQVAESDISLAASETAEYSNACLDAARAGEMCAQMMLTGWRLQLRCDKEAAQVYEYRAAKNQLRLFNFNGQNYKVYP
jgi:hypothetical protein